MLHLTQLMTNGGNWLHNVEDSFRSARRGPPHSTSHCSPNFYLTRGETSERILYVKLSAFPNSHVGGPHVNARSKLLDRVSAIARLKHLSIRTEKAYRQHIKCFIIFHKLRHPEEMAEDEIRAYLSHLASDLNVAASTQNVALAALLFCIEMS